MRPYEIDGTIEWLKDEDGKVVGYRGNNAIDYALDGALLDRETLRAMPALAALDSLVAARTRSAVLKLATFGDSTANIGSGGGPHDVRLFTAPHPPSGATVLAFNTMEKLAISYLLPVQIVGNGGISGETTTQMVARDTAGSSSSRKAAADIVALDPDAILARCGSINDLINVTSATLAARVGEVLARHRILLARLSARGALVIDEGIAGFANGSANTAAELPALLSAVAQLNALYKADAEASGGKVVFIDPVGLTCDSSGAFLPGLSNDGTHLNAAGALVLGKAERTVLASRFGSPARRFSGVNLVANSNMAATGAVTGGTAATGFSPSSTNATRSNAAVVARDGAIWQQCDYLATAAAANASIFLPFPIPSWGLLAGNELGIEFPFSIESIDGGPLPSLAQILARLDLTKTAAGRVVVDTLAFAAASSLGVSRLSGTVVFPRFALSEPSSALTTASVLTLSVTMVNSGDAIRLGVGAPNVVNLSA